MKRIYRNILFVLIGLFTGWLLFHNSGKDLNEQEVHEHGEEVEAVIWTCSMHPQIRMDEPGDCPICGMDLIPFEQAGSTAAVDQSAVSLTKEAAELANISTTIVSRGKSARETRLYGRVVADERLVQSQVSHVAGRIEKLAVNFTGETIRKGQVLATVYSPELITAQQELLEVSRTKQNFPELYEAARERLRQLRITESLIDEVEQSGKVITEVDIVSGTSGVVTARNVNSGDYIGQGTVLFQVADLSRLWVMFDAYESDLPFVRKGDKMNFTVQAVPGRTFTGTVSYIDPVIDPVTRVARARIETGNMSGELKPEMFVTGNVISASSVSYEGIIVPKSAVLWTGVRSLVYVRQPATDDPVFNVREVMLGADLGDNYIVTSGLIEGEEVVTNGTFSVDAAAQLAGKPSMMNTGGTITSAAHNHDVSPGTSASSSGISSVIETKKVSNVGSVPSDNSNTEFSSQLTLVYDEYVKLKNALVEGNDDVAVKSASSLGRSLAEVNMGLLKGDDHNKWMKILSNINSALNSVNTATDLELRRSAFSELSNQIYEAVNSFGLNSGTVYYQFCPMYNNNQGAYWLSESAGIRNPYYGSAMLTCGETVDTLEFR